MKTNNVKMMGEWKIESGVAIPGSSKRGSSNGGIPLVSVFRTMSPGDSCVVPRTGAAQAWGVAKERGLKVTTRRVGKNKVRVWLFAGVSAQASPSSPAGMEKKPKRKRRTKKQMAYALWRAKKMLLAQQASYQQPELPMEGQAPLV